MSKSAKKSGVKPENIRSENVLQFIWTFRLSRKSFIKSKEIRDKFEEKSFQARFLEENVSSRPGIKFKKVVSRKTIFNWLQYFRTEIDSNGDSLDKFSPVEWHQLETNGLPWEMSGVWEDFRKLSDGNLSNYFKPSQCLLAWWWRLNQLSWVNKEKPLELSYMYENVEMAKVLKLSNNEPYSLKYVEDLMWKCRDSEA